MIKAEFSYNSNITIILCSENDTMEEICKKFTSKVNIDINNLIFYILEIKSILDNKFTKL